MKRFCTQQHTPLVFSSERPAPALCLQYNQHPAGAVSGKCLKLISGTASCKTRSWPGGPTIYCVLRKIAQSGKPGERRPQNGSKDMKGGGSRKKSYKTPTKKKSSEAAEQRLDLWTSRCSRPDFFSKSYGRPRSRVALRRERAHRRRI